MAPKICKVCGCSATKIHFGALVCKACSAFFRRSMAENKEYRCRYSDDCNISSSRRNDCRKNPKNILLQLPEFPEVLQTLASSYETFCSSQKSIFKIQNFDSILLTSESKFKPMTKEEHNKMENANMDLIVNFLKETFPIFENLSIDEKHKIFGTFGVRFIKLHQALMTSKYFPEKNDITIVFHYGYYSGKDDFETFFGKDDGSFEALYRNHLPFLIAFKKFSTKVGELNLSFNEIGGLMGLIFYSQLEQLQTSSLETSKSKSEIIGQLYLEVTKNHENYLGGIRFGTIVHLLFDLECVIQTFKNSLIIGDLIGRGHFDDVVVLGKT
ncbi:hypothetical protein FO519_006369 [Halicephalobus sp. NKZ332]|nr:hypothetical protein FO519_006369 [Halicephalobus sp. NKZ332]